eukprot:9187951-Heterocapsa_arctica.AAC.1
METQITERERTDHFVHRQFEGRGSELGRINSEATYWQHRTFLEEQQNRNNETAEVMGDQIDDGRSKRGHNGRTTPRSSLHGFAKHEGRQKCQNQCGHGSRSRSTTRKTRLQVLQEVRHQGHS